VSRPVLGPSAVVSGAVRGRDAKPVANARVCATEATSEAVWQPIVICAETDVDGRYRIEIATGGAYFVTAVASGFAPGSAAEGNALLFAAGARVSDVDIWLDRGGAQLSGVVLDATGGPVPGASLRATGGTSPHHTVSVLSDSTGRFTLWASPGPLTIMVEASGYAPDRVLRVAPSHDVVIRLFPAAVVRGEVVAATDGHPLGNMLVRAVPAGLPVSPTQPFATTEEDGTFEINDLEPGSYIFVAEGERWRGSSGRPISIGLAEQRERVRVVASAAAGVTGRVVMVPSGKPCTQGTVGLGPGSPGMSNPFDPPDASGSTLPFTPVPTLQAAIASNGGVHFPAVPQGNYHVLVECADQVFARGPMDLAVGAADVDGLEWQVSEGARLTLRFVSDSEQPLPGVTGLLAFPRRGAEPRAKFPVVADESGRYVYPGTLYPGVYTIEASDGYEAQPVDVVVGTGSAEGVLRFVGQASIFVNVKSSQGEPVDDVRVYATRAVTGDASTRRDLPPPVLENRIMAVALGNGLFRIGPVAAARWDVCASDGVNEPFSPPQVDMTSRRRADVSIVVDHRASLRGRVVDGSGQPVPDARVAARCEKESALDPQIAAAARYRSPAQRVVSDAEGRFVVDGLAVGARCMLEASSVTEIVGVVRGATPGQDVTMTIPGAGRLAGTVAGEETSAHDPVQLVLRNVDTGQVRREVVTLSGGRWSVDNVQPGSTHIEARRGAARAGADVEVRSDVGTEDVRLEFASGQGAPLSGVPR
jgi:hypothetical protein